ncbi:hypothetical protein BGX29_005235 [Mortierella sp. GBA35]|nr:hypothetical protein BGX29_005235 [Mortierella sp. GBA35]
MPGCILPVYTATKAPSKVLSEAMKATGSSFKLAYFNLHGRAESARYLLAYGGDRPTDTEWQRQKPNTPFKCLPLVYETTSSGAMLELSEVLSTERYLADKFGLAGSDLWERFQVEQAVSSIETSQLMYHYKVLLPNWPSADLSNSSDNQAKRKRRAEDANQFYMTGLKNFVDIHEAKLEENRGNGHYVSDKTSLADIRAIMLIGRLMLLRPEGANQSLLVK